MWAHLCGAAQYAAVNGYACKVLGVLGYSREELLRMTVPEVAVEPEAPALYEAMVAEGPFAAETVASCRCGTGPAR